MIPAIPGWELVETTHLHAGLGVQLFHAHDGSAPVGGVTLTLDADDGAGGWARVPREPRWLRRGLAFFPYLERHADAAGRGPRQYRVGVQAELYQPLYLWQQLAGEVATVHPWDDVTEPTHIAPRPLRIPLLPRPSCPFAGVGFLLRGYVINPDQTPVATALVEFDGLQVLTEASGEFALPMTRAPAGMSLVDVAALDGRTDVFPVTLPDELSAKVVFTLN